MGLGSEGNKGPGGGASGKPGRGETSHAGYGSSRGEGLSSARDFAEREFDRLRTQRNPDQTLKEITEAFARNLERTGNVLGIDTSKIGMYDKMDEPFGVMGRSLNDFFSSALPNELRTTNPYGGYQKYSSFTNPDTYMGLFNPYTPASEEIWGKTGKYGPGWAKTLNTINKVGGALVGPLSLSNMLNPYAGAVSALGGLLEIAGLATKSPTTAKIGKAVENLPGALVGNFDELLAGLSKNDWGPLGRNFNVPQKHDIMSHLDWEARSDIQNLNKGIDPFTSTGKSAFDVARNEAMIDAAVNALMGGLGQTGVLGSLMTGLSQNPMMENVALGGKVGSSLLGAFNQPGLAKAVGLATSPVRAIPEIAKEVLSYAVNKQPRAGGFIAGLQANPQGGFTTPTGGTISPSGVYHSAGSVTNTGEGRMDYGQLLQYLVNNGNYNDNRVGGINGLVEFTG